MTETAVQSIWLDPTTSRLSRALTTLDSIDTMQSFLRDILTEKEIIEISMRLEAARLLTTGSTYTEVIRQTRLSSRTVARISDWIKKGNGGYTAALATSNYTTPHHAHLPPAHAA